MPPPTFKTVQCPECDTRISVKVAGIKAKPSSVAATGCGGALVGVLAEFGAQFPGPLSVAVAAWAVGQIMVVVWPFLAKQLGGDERLLG